MNLATRMILILALLFTTVNAAVAQETATATATETTSTSAAPAEPAADEAEPAATTDSATRQTAYQVRNHFTNLLREHPPRTYKVLALDPMLLSNEAFLAETPEIARFVEEHPQIRRNPHFYMAGFAVPGEERRSAIGNIIEMLSIISTIALIAGALAWLVRTIIEQKRWNRLSKTQSEVHNKILDRFASSEELMAYIKTPAGSRFLESTPIPLHEEKTRAIAAPINRVLWSMQLGVIVAVGSLGLMLISGRFEGEGAKEIFAMGMVFFFIGGGFIASSIVSLALSRRLGLWRGSGADAPGIDDPAGVR